MNTEELIQALDSHTGVLRERGTEVSSPEVLGPATSVEIDEVEARLGLPMPQTLRAAFAETTSGVRWRWQSPDGVDFDEPFGPVFSGGLDWSLQGLVAQHHNYQEWVKECFSDPDDPYDKIWHHKLGLAHVPNGDCIAIDLAPDHLGEVVYLSHDDGEGHGYVLANSLDDLLDRWVPLACPGPEDWQWLLFVPYDFGPIDPAGENGLAWRELCGLSAAPPRTRATTPDDDLFDELLARYRTAGGDWASYRLAMRAARVCSSERADVVLDLLDDRQFQGEAARLLGAWKWRPAVDALKRISLTGSNHGRMSAIAALRKMPWPEARSAVDELRERLDASWQPYLNIGE